MSAKPAPVTPLEAKEVWEATPKPSARKVADRLTASGRPVSFKTIARWKEKEWGLTPEQIGAAAPAAKEKLDEVAAAVTKDALATSETVRPLVAALDGKTTNSTLTESALRESIQTARHLAAVMQETAPMQMLAPDMAGKSILSIVEAITKAADGLKGLAALRESEMKTVSGLPPENTALRALLENSPKKDAA